MHNLTEFILVALLLLVLVAGLMVAIAHAKVLKHQRECEGGVCPAGPPHARFGIHVHSSFVRQSKRQTQPKNNPPGPIHHGYN